MSSAEYHTLSSQIGNLRFLVHFNVIIKFRPIVGQSFVLLCFILIGVNADNSSVLNINDSLVYTPKLLSLLELYCKLYSRRK